MQEEEKTEICSEGNPKLSYLSFWLQLSIMKYTAASWGETGAAGSSFALC